MGVDNKFQRLLERQLKEKLNYQIIEHNDNLIINSPYKKINRSLKDKYIELDPIPENNDFISPNFLELKTINKYLNKLVDHVRIIKESNEILLFDQPKHIVKYKDQKKLNYFKVNESSDKGGREKRGREKEVIDPISYFKECKNIKIDHKLNYNVKIEKLNPIIHKLVIKHKSNIIKRSNQIKKFKFKKDIKRSLSKKLKYYKIIVESDEESENKESDIKPIEPVKVEDNYKFNDQYVLKLDNTLLTAIHMNNDLEKAKIIAKQLDCFSLRGKDIVIPLEMFVKIK